MLKALITAWLTVVVASSAFAQMKDMPMEHRGPGHMAGCDMCVMDKHGEEMGGMMDKCLQMADKLGLSEEQINKIKPIHKAMKKEQIRFRADLQLAELDLKDIMEVKDFDLDKASAQVKKIGDMKTTQHLEMLKSMKEVHAILTDEQFKKMQKMMPMMMQEHKAPKKMIKKK